jgi:ubiquinone/menaquinone biosynthesis C-methylase UbiE
MAGWDGYWEKIAESGYINYTPELLSTLASLVALEGKVILEVGGGTGGNASWLAERGATVYLLDYSRNALQISRRASEIHGVELGLVRANGFFLPFPDGYFDLVYHVGVLHLFRKPAGFIQEQHRVLKQNGYLVVDVPQRFSPYTLWKRLLIRLKRWPYGAWETQYSFNQLEQLFRDSGFEPLTAYGRDYFPNLLGRLRNLQKIEGRLFRNGKGLPDRFWSSYRRLWERFERSRLGLYFLMDIGVVGQKTA